MEHWTDIGILDQGAEFQRLGMTFEELGFDAIDERNESRMLAPLGVPAILLSTRLGLSRSTYSNYEQAKAQFWTDTFKPELQLFEVEFQNALKMDDGSWPAFDFSEIAVLQRNVVPLTGAAYQMWQMGVPANTAFRVAGIPNMPDIVGGDVGYLPPTLVPVGVTPQPSAAVAPGARRQTEMARETEVAQGKSLLPSAPQRPPLTSQRKAVLWRSMDRTARAWERKFRDAARAQFSLDLRALLAALGDRQKAMIQRKESVDWAEVGDDWEQILANAKDRWREAFVPLIQGVVSHQGERLALAFGMQFDVRNFLGEKWLRDYTLRFAQPIMDTTKGAVKAIVQDALEKGSSIPQMQQRLTALFETWAGDRELTEEDRQWFLERLPANRTEMIARTETIRASNAGAEALYRDWGVTQKQWLATQDDRTRPDHLDADGQVVGMEESFSVGGEGLMYPGDPSGSPDNTINCRCTVLPVMVNE
jgi:SPP1 gp7 family putative phage head morphogenesis protein